MREEKWSIIITVTVLVILTLMAVKEIVTVPSYDAVVEEPASNGGSIARQLKPKDFGDNCTAAKAHYETTGEESHCNVPDFPAGKIVFSENSL